MSERRQYSRAEWISAGVFFVIVMGFIAWNWPSSSDYDYSSSADSESSPDYGYSSSPDGESSSDSDGQELPEQSNDSEVKAPAGGLAVTASRFTEWPFTVSAGVLRCEGGAVTFEPPGGPRYAVNGTAKGAGYAAITPIWADDETLGYGLKVDISEVLDEGLSLC
ncbi:hypothetical protein [Streptomyces sp. NPDC058451]|uniref:hypothetical protein n=1 Tax=Streptomyces sp. NPDC058451 TaxID=3346506 RepID=UPI00365411AA